MLVVSCFLHLFLHMHFQGMSFLKGNWEKVKKKTNKQPRRQKETSMFPQQTAISCCGVRPHC